VPGVGQLVDRHPGRHLEVEVDAVQPGRIGRHTDEHHRYGQPGGHRNPIVALRDVHHDDRVA
jgi:hypothetical protein